MMTKHLDRILTPEMLKAGYTVAEESDDFVHLYFKGNPKPIATFGQRTTALEIHNEVLNHREEYERGRYENSKA